MIRLRWFLLLIALATVFSAWHVWWTAQNRTAADLLQAAESRIERNAADVEGALRELDLALQLAALEGSREVAEAALRKRAELNLQRGNHLLALEDCDVLLEGYARGDEEVLDMAAQAAFRQADLERAIGYAEELVQVAPRTPASHILKGQLHQALAEVALRELRERLEGELPSRLADDGLAHARRAAALPAMDPHARAASEALDELAKDEEALRANRALTARAREHLETARASWLAALSRTRAGEAIVGLQDLLENAGLNEAVASLGRAALQRPRFLGWEEVLVRTTLAQVELGRPDAARRMIEELSTAREEPMRMAGFSNDLIVRWAVLLHELRIWPVLDEAVVEIGSRRNLMQSNRTVSRAVPYLRGVALLEQHRTQAALPWLTRGGRYSNEHELVPGEQVLFWTTRAAVERRMAMRPEERISIREATQVRAVPEPDGSPAARAYGEALERQAQVHERNGGYVQSLELLARAVAFLPERREELIGRWHRLGEQALAASEKTLEHYEQITELRTIGGPLARLNSWATIAVARRALESGAPSTAVTLVRPRLDDLGSFPPLLEVAGDAYAADGDWKRAAGCWLRLGQLFGYTPELAERLAGAPREELPPETLVEWAALDPRRALLSGVVRELEEEGRIDVALKAIRYVDGHAATAEEMLLAGRLAISGRDWAGAYESLVRIAVDDPLFPEAAPLLLRAAVERPAPREPGSSLQLALTHLRAAAELDPAGFGPALDALLARGLAREAADVADLLTADPSRRDPQIILRRAVAAVTEGDEDEAVTALDRASVYVGGDLDAAVVLVGRVLLAVETGDEAELERAGLELIRYPLARDPLRSGVVRLLLDDTDRALPRLEDADAQREGLDYVARLALLTGLTLVHEDEQDPSLEDAELARQLRVWREELAALADGLGPRHVLALLLALESPPWQGWAATRLVQLSPQLGSHAWAQLLSAYAAAALDGIEDATRLVTQLTEGGAELPWAWVLLEQLELRESGGEIDLGVIRARAGRVLAIGGRGLDPDEAHRLVAEVLAYLGRTGAAGRVLRAALRAVPASDPRRPRLLVDLARVSETAGRPEEAFECYQELQSLLPAEAFAPHVPGVLDLLRTLRARGLLSPTAHLARLEALAARFPNDPAPVRAVAEQLLSKDDALQDSPVSRAKAQLERFRDRTRNSSLESLREGEASRWVDLLARLDPAAAERLAYDELLESPYSLELWRTWADALRAARRHEHALSVFRTLAAVVPDEASMKSLAQILLEAQEDPRLALAATKQARKQLPPGQEDRELDLIEAVALASRRGPEFEQGVRRMQQLLVQVQRDPGLIEAVEVAVPLLESLRARGTRRDLERVVRLGRESATVLRRTDGLRAAWFEAMALLARQDLP